MQTDDWASRRDDHQENKVKDLEQATTRKQQPQIVNRKDEGPTSITGRGSESQNWAYHQKSIINLTG